MSHQPAESPATVPVSAFELKPKIKLITVSQGIAYVEHGAGEILLLVHGSLCDYRYWNPQLIGLSPHYHVVAPSLSHHHPPLPSSARQRFSWLMQVEQLAGFIGKLGSRRIHLVGHSRGACIAYQVALRHPSLAASLTLVDPGGPKEGDEVETGDVADSMRALRARAVELIASGSIDEGLRMFVDSTSRPGFWDRSAAQFQQMARDNAGTLGPQLADPLPAYRADDADSISCPSLLVQGERSPAVYRSNADFLAQHLPQANRVTIDGASHGMTWTHHQAFNRYLTAFLSRHSRA